MTPLNLQSANKLLSTHMRNQNLKRHCLAVGKALAEYYDYYKSINKNTGNLTQEQWEICGLLHDSDYEETKDDTSKHTLVLLEWLKEYDVPTEMVDVFKTHNNRDTHLKEPQTLLEWTLECCDELTGFIVAVALVMPEKKLAEVTVDRILAKFKQKEFAKQVDRNQILQCQEKTGTAANTFIEITLKSMQSNHDLLGL